MSEPEPTLKTKTYNINNKRLFKEVDDFMVELFAAASVDWQNEDHREQIVDLIEETFHDLAASTGQIVQFDVICDRRNNPRSIQKGNPLKMTVKYKQKNCLNTTVIEYELTL